jgi:hypothetical protein
MGAARPSITEIEKGAVVSYSFEPYGPSLSDSLSLRIVIPGDEIKSFCWKRQDNGFIAASIKVWRVPIAFQQLFSKTQCSFLTRLVGHSGGWGKGRERRELHPLE